MDKSPAYQPLYQDEELSEEKSGIVHNANESKLIPTKSRSFIIYFTILLLSLSTNVLLVYNNRSVRILHDRTGSIYSGLKYDTAVSYQPVSKFWHNNITESDMEDAWDNIDTNAVAVTLHNDFAKSVDLPPSSPFPWDTDRSIYYIKGIHDLHCVKLLRKAITSKHNGNGQPINLKHLYHCLDGLRQDIMCTADDTPMPALLRHHIGEGQIRQCRDWNKLIAWAQRPDRHACYRWDDYKEATNILELFAFCPEDSPYRAFQERYFKIHGHRDMYEPMSNMEPIEVF